jgi:ZIP family zinc transporter
MLEAAFWGFVGGSALLAGAAVALLARVPVRIVGLVLGFGAGVLISAVAFELTVEAADRGGWDAVAVGLAGGALAFYFGDLYVDRRGGEHRKMMEGGASESVAFALVLGAVLDGIPESVALGVTLLEGGEVSTAFIAAVFISNLPEGLASSALLRTAGRSPAYIAGLWLAIAVISALAAGLGYAVLDGASDDMIAWIQAFAAGAILTMLADNMLPDAHEQGGNTVGLMTVLGFALSAYLSSL